MHLLNYSHGNMRTKAEAYTNFIVNELKKGNVGFEDVFELILTKFNLSRPTFAKYWKQAKETHFSERNEQKKIIEANSTTKEIEALKSQIVTSEQKKVILSQIFEAKIDVDDIAVDRHGNATPYKRKPTASERMKAVDILNKMEGDIAPTKVEQKNIVDLMGIAVEYKDV